MKTFDHFFEDIAERQALLKQRQKDQAAAYKKRTTAATSAARSDLTQRSADARQRANTALDSAMKRRKAIAAARAEAEEKKREREEILEDLIESGEIELVGIKRKKTNRTVYAYRSLEE